MGRDVSGPDPGRALEAGQATPFAGNGQVEEGEPDADAFGHASAMLKISL
jgi:hypothetical protein